AALPRSNTTDNLSSILDGLKRVKRALAASDTLHNQTGVLIYKYAHLSNSLRRDILKLEEYCVSNSELPDLRCTTRLISNFPSGHSYDLVAATTFSAASFIPSATMKFSPELRRICCPCSTFVPSSLTTTGTCTPVALAASTTLDATTSHRIIPPKILINTAFTFLSDRRMRNAFFTCSSDAPPPTSRKFAGLPPASLMISIVAIARPAPLTMQATSPSSLM